MLDSLPLSDVQTAQICRGIHMKRGLADLLVRRAALGAIEENMARSISTRATAMTLGWSFFIDDANPLAASVARVRSRRRAAQLGYLNEMREPRRQEKLQAPARHGAVTSKRSVQRDATAKASSRSASLCPHVGDEPAQTLLDHSLVLFELSPPCRSLACALRATRYSARGIL